MTENFTLVEVITPDVKPNRKAILLYLAGVVIMAFICIVQIYTDLISGAEYYVLPCFIGLWVLRNYRFLYLIGIPATVAMTAGYFLGEPYSPGSFVNMLLSVIAVWIAIFFTTRFRKVYLAELMYKKQVSALFENVTEAILLIDSQGKIVLSNRGSERVFGYNQRELLSMQLEELIPERFRSRHPSLRTLYMSVPTTRRVGEGKNVYALRKDGTEVPVEISLSYYYDNRELLTIAFVTDITERKRQDAKIAAQYEQLEQYNQRLEQQVKIRTAELVDINTSLLNQIEERKRVEEQLRKSQFLYKAVASNFPEGVIAVVNEDLSFVFVDGKEVTVGTNTPEKKHPGVHLVVISEHADRLKQAFAGQTVNFEVGVGDSFYDVIATPFAALSSQATEILMVIRNITRHKKFEENLLRSLEKEKQLNVMKSRFVSSVSHEFRTPLSTILSSTFLLENYAGPELETHRKTHLNRIKRSVNNLTELLDDFLSLGKLEEGKIKVIYTEFYIREYLAELINELSPIRKKDQEIRLNFSGEDELISLDKSLLTNVLTNLISNAIKYSNPDGLIEVNAHIKKEVLTLYVRDYGMGIPEKEQRYIFRRFFRAQNAVNIQGTGLGLNLVRKYVRLMKGTVAFKSRLEHGSTFIVTIPVSIQTNVTTSTQKEYA